jgi:5-aminolevulinate synthase
MDFEAFFEDKLGGLHKAGNYRVFADIERHAGLSARDALSRRWLHAGRDGLVLQRLSGHGPESMLVVARCKEAIDRCGSGRAAPATSPAPIITTCFSSASLPICTARKTALIFTSGYVSNWAALGTLAAKIPGLIVYSDALNHASMIEGFVIRAARSGSSSTMTEDLRRLMARTIRLRRSWSPSRASIRWMATSRRSPRSATSPTSSAR